MWELLKFKDNPAMIAENGETFSYAQLYNDCNALASKIPPRSLVFALCSNTVGSMEGYVAFISHRIVPLLLDSNIDNGLLRILINTYRPQYIWLPEDSRHDLHGERIYSSRGYMLIRINAGKAPDMHDDLALLMGTSGSTGSPKLVRQSYVNLKSNACSIAEYLELDESERPITTLPMSYVYGLSIINSHLLTGGAVILCSQPIIHREFWDVFKNQKATSFGGVPYTYEMLSKLRFFERDLPSLRYMTQAGGKLHPDMHKKYAEYCKKTGKKFVVMYGQAEATARMGWLPPDKALEKCGSMGIAIPGGKLKIVDDDGNTITEPEVAGELIYEGPNVTMGYAVKLEDLALPDEWHGILKTGDMAVFDADRYFRIVGRKKRFLKVFGNRVGLDELERLVKSQYSAIECACCGKDDKVRVFITGGIKTGEVREFLSTKTKLHPTAFKVEHINELPKNEYGKTLYHILEKMTANE